jgi:hypothetical protein
MCQRITKKGEKCKNKSEPFCKIHSKYKVETIHVHYILQDNDGKN